MKSASRFSLLRGEKSVQDERERKSEGEETHVGFGNLLAVSMPGTICETKQGHLELVDGAKGRTRTHLLSDPGEQADGRVVEAVRRRARLRARGRSVSAAVSRSWTRRLARTVSCCMA